MEEHEATREEVMLRDYYLRHCASQPDVDAELAAFKGRHFRQGMPGMRRHLYRLVAGVAASVAVVILSYFIYMNNAVDGSATVQTSSPASPGGVTVYERSSDVAGSITLTKGGKTVAVRDKSIDCSAATASGSSLAEMQTVCTPYNTTAEVTLADGTEVILNAGSRITFPVCFQEDNRTVELHGEAYFKVAHDSGRPFVVKAGTVQTRVLGTKFGVRAWERSDTRVSLVEGSVEVSTETESRRLRICERAVVTDNGALQVSDCDPDEVKAWTEGEFYFDNREMLDVARDIGRWYGVNVVFNSMEHAHTKVFFSACRYDSLDDIIAIINSFDIVKVKKEEGKIVIN